MYQINPTQFVGLLSFSVTAALCFAVWRSTQNARSTWAWITIAYAGLAIDVLLSGRHLLSGALRSILRTIDLYQNRGFLQILIVFLLIAIALAIVGMTVRLSRQQVSSASKAALATALTLLFFLVETVSAHKIDAILYQKAGPILFIGWIWIALATLTITIAIGALKRHSEEQS
jgi:magnesium-transporting ATPase (P-type)